MRCAAPSPTEAALRGSVWIYTRPALAGHPIPLCALRRAALTLGTSDPHGLRWPQYPSFDPTRLDAAPPYAPSGAGEARYRSPVRGGNGRAFGHGPHL
eukprot:tig00021617_g22933.t1